MLSHCTYSYTVRFYSFALELYIGTDYCTTIKHRYRLLHNNYTQVQITAQQL